MARNRLLIPLLAIALLALGSPLRAMAPARATAAFAIVDAFSDGGELEAAVEALAEAKIDAEDLRDVLTEGRRYEQIEAGKRTIEVTDGYGRTTEVVVVTPSGYSPGKPVGIAFMLHGLGGDGNQLAGLLAEFAQKERMLIVCPTAQSLPSNSPNPDAQIIQNLPQAAGTHWWSYGSGNFVMTLLKKLGREYDIDRDRVVLSGYSMGGFGTWNIGMRFADRFAAFVPFAGGVSGREYLGGDDSLMRSLVPNLVGRPVFFVHGDADSTVPVRFSQRTDTQLKEKGNKSHVYLEVPGGSHRLNVAPGSSIMKQVEKWLKGKKRTPNPKEVRHSICDTDHGSCHWLRIEKLVGETGSVQGRLKSKGKLDVVAEGVETLTVRLNDTLAKPGKKITITLNGKKAFKGKVEPSIECLLTTWAEAEDPALLYDAKVELEVPAKR